MESKGFAVRRPYPECVRAKRYRHGPMRDYPAGEGVILDFSFGGPGGQSLLRFRNEVIGILVAVVIFIVYAAVSSYFANIPTCTPGVAYSRIDVPNPYLCSDNYNRDTSTENLVLTLIGGAGILALALSAISLVAKSLGRTASGPFGNGRVEDQSEEPENDQLRGT